MQVGSVEVPGSRSFQVGVAITFGIVAIAGILTALPIPVVGAIVILGGWAIGGIAGIIGGAYVASSSNLTEGGDGAKIGALTGGLGNAVGAVIGIVALAIAAAVQGGTSIPAQTPGGSPTTVGSGQIVLGVVIIGLVGLVSGTIAATIGGVIGGYVGTRL